MRAVESLTPCCLLNVIMKRGYSVCTSDPITLSSVFLSSLCNGMMGSQALCHKYVQDSDYAETRGERFWTEGTKGLRIKVRKDKGNLVDEFGEDGW